MTTSFSFLLSLILLLLLFYTYTFTQEYSYTKQVLLFKVSAVVASMMSDTITSQGLNLWKTADLLFPHEDQPSRAPVCDLLSFPYKILSPVQSTHWFLDFCQSQFNIGSSPTPPCKILSFMHFAIPLRATLFEMDRHINIYICAQNAYSLTPKVFIFLFSLKYKFISD